MGEDGNARRIRFTAAHQRWLVRGLSVALVLAGSIGYLRKIELRQEPLRLPLKQLVVSPARKQVETIPARAGALAGQNLLLVTLDTTRPDRLGCYGNPGAATPHLDALAADGVIFSNAVSVGPTTLPTHASILTGLYPPSHGARANALFQLGGEHRTLAEVLVEHGYETAAFVSSFVLDARFGLAQGFGRYDSESSSETSANFGFSERSADATTERALQWLRAPRAGPFFLWVHYYDPHVPYEPPAAFDGAETPYDGEIAFVDQQLGRLLEEVESAAGPGTLVVVAGDHGEALGEHGELSHGLLVQEATLRIPLILRSSRGLSGGFHVTTRASQVDLAPTVLSLLGATVPEGVDGIDLTLPTAARRPVLAETLEGRANYGWARLAALYRDDFKYVGGPRPALYDFSRDSLERRNLAPEEPVRLEELRRELLAFGGTADSDLASSRSSLAAEDVARLQALGYLVASDDVVPQGEGGPDPHRMLPLMIRIQLLLNSQRELERLPAWKRLLGALSANPLPSTPAALIRELEKLASEHPDFAPVHGFLASLYRRENRQDEAERASEHLERAIRSGTP